VTGGSSGQWPRCAGDRRDVGRQYLAAGLIDELHIHLVPVLLGRGVSLFEHPGTDPIGWAAPEVTQSPRVTHLRYRLS
jgi:dihydrofolate reductase